MDSMEKGDLFVNYSTSSKLKQIGFDDDCFGYWNMINYSGEYVFDDRIWEYSDNYEDAPSIDQTKNWFLLKHNIWVYVDYNEINETFMFVIKLISNKNFPRIFTNDGFNSPKNAYHSAFNYIIDNDLINNKS